MSRTFSIRTLSPALILLLTVAVCLSAHAIADDWQQKKAERLKPVSQDEKAAIEAALPAEPTVKAQQPRRVLVFYRCGGFIHTSIPHGNHAVAEMGRKTGAFTVDFADTYDVFNADNLNQYDAILLNNSTGMQFETPAQQNAFLDFVANGKGLIGIHAASDNFGKHPQCRALVGGEFGGHPWNAGGLWAFQLDDPQHTLNRAFGGEGFWHTDEIYQYKSDTYQGPEVLRVLVSLDMSRPEVSERIDDGPRQVPVSWLRQAGEGRVFYTNFGHREDTYENPMILRHMLDGIQYALGDLPADATPTAKAAPMTPALAPAQPAQ